MDWTQYDNLFHAARYREAYALVAPEAEAARASDDVLSAIRLTVAESSLLHFLGRAEQAVQQATWAIAVASQPEVVEGGLDRGTTWEITSALISWCQAARDMPEIGLATLHPVIDQGESFVTATGYREWQGSFVSERAAMLHEERRFEEAHDAYLQAIELKQRLPSSPGITLDSLTRSDAQVLIELGRLEEAQALLDPLLDHGSTRPIDRLAAEVYLAQGLLDDGHIDASVAYAELAIATADPMGLPQQSAAWGIAVEAFVAAGQLERAEEAAAKMLGFAAMLDTDVEWCDAHLDSFDVALARGRLEQAAEHLAEVERRVTRIEAQRPTHHREALEERRTKLASASLG